MLLKNHQFPGGHTRVSKVRGPVFFFSSKATDGLFPGLKNTNEMGLSVFGVPMRQRYNSFE